MSHPARWVTAALLATASLPVAMSSAQDAWPRFRGPNGTGQGVVLGVSGEWTDANRLWTTKLPGRGHGSPVVDGGRVFLVSGDGEKGECTLLAFDVASGDAVWRRGLEGGGPRKMHADNSYATATPALDGERVYITWAVPDEMWIAAFTYAGEPVWSRSLGAFANAHGFGHSPMVVGDLVVVAGDQLGESAVVALDATTGEPRWRTPQPIPAKAGYATPCVVEAGGQTAIVAHCAAGGIVGLDPTSGSELWRLADVFPARPVASAVAAGGVLLGTCGGGGTGKQMVALQLDQAGAAPIELFRLRKGVPYVPTPLFVGDLVFLWHDRGTVVCIDRTTGQKHWEERIGGRFYCSPVYTGEAVLAVSTAGEAVSIAVDPAACRVLSRNDLGGPTHATPAIAGNRLYLRTESQLMCVAGAATARAGKAIGR